MDKVKALKGKDESTWTTANHKTMLSCKQQKGDPAHAKTIAELKQQWADRKDHPSPKYTPAYEPPARDDDQDDEDSDNVIIMRTDGEQAAIM